MAAAYQLIFNSSNILRTSDNAIIPNDEFNSDYKAYLDWVQAGNTPDPVPLSVKQNAALNALMLKRDSVIASGVTYNANLFLSDDSAQNILHKALYTQSSGIKADVFPRSWILANGTSISITYTDAQAVALAMENKMDAAYANYLTLEAQIKASNNPESIDITTGWPA